MKKNRDVNASPTQYSHAPSRVWHRSSATNASTGTKHLGQLHVERPFTTIWKNESTAQLSPETARRQIDVARTSFEIGMSNSMKLGHAIGTIVTAVTFAKQKQQDSIIRQQERDTLQKKLQSGAALNADMSAALSQSLEVFSKELKEKGCDRSIQNLSKMKSCLYKWRAILHNQHHLQMTLQANRLSLLRKSVNGWVNATAAVWRKTKIMHCVTAFQTKASRHLGLRCLFRWMASSNRSILLKHRRSETRSSTFLMSMLLLKGCKKLLTESFCAWQHHYMFRKWIKSATIQIRKNSDKRFKRKLLSVWNVELNYQKSKKRSKIQRLGAANLMTRRFETMCMLKALLALKSHSGTKATTLHGNQIKNRMAGKMKNKMMLLLTQKAWKSWKNATNQVKGLRRHQIQTRCFYYCHDNLNMTCEFDSFYHNQTNEG